MLTDPETQKLQAALEQLESERQRRIDERIEKGEVVRVLPVVVGLPDGIEAAKAAEVAKLQAAGETREVPDFARCAKLRRDRVIFSRPFF